MTVGEKIRFLRKKENISQADFAAMLKISKQTLYKYEKDMIVNIPYEKIETVARIADVSPAYLIGWREPGAVDEEYYSGDVQFDRLCNYYKRLSGKGKQKIMDYLQDMLKIYAATC